MGRFDDVLLRLYRDGVEIYMVSYHEPKEGTFAGLGLGRLRANEAPLPGMPPPPISGLISGASHWAVGLLSAALGLTSPTAATPPPLAGEARLHEPRYPTPHWSAM